MAEFTERFKKRSNSELLKIINSEGEYELAAIEAAKNIFTSRALTHEEIEFAKSELLNQRQEKESQKQRKIDNVNKVKEFGTSLADTLNPIQKSTPTTDKIIKITSLLFAGLFLFLLYNEFGMIGFMFTDNGAKWDFSTAFYFLPLLLIPIAAILFYKRKKLGWALLAFYIIYSVISTIFIFIEQLTRKPSIIPALDNLFPKVSMVTLIGTMFFWCGFLWVICRKDIREIYNLDRRKTIITIGIISLFNLVIIYSLLS